MHRHRILIDLDGVLNTYSGNYQKNKIEEVKKGAKEFLKNLAKDYDLYLFTTRNLLLASKWLIKNGLDKYFIDVTNVKITATIHLDDRAICFNGDFEEAFNKIKNFKTFWEKN